jgi:hypothetical protein
MKSKKKYTIINSKWIPKRSVHLSISNEKQKYLIVKIK